MTQGTANLFLSALSINSRDRLLSRAVAMPLPLRTVLYERNETPRYAYFITSGMASVVTTMRDGATAEVKLVGCEGVVGVLHLLGPAKVETNAFMQIAGTGLRLPFHELQQAYRSNNEIRERILEYVQAQAVITDQIAGCNRLHDADTRLAADVPGPCPVRRPDDYAGVPCHDGRLDADHSHGPCRIIPETRMD